MITVQKQLMEVFWKLTVLHLPGSLKLNKLPEAKSFFRTFKDLARKLENEERSQSFQKFSCRNTSIFTMRS